MFRLREQDFGELRRYGGISPGWPISYSDLEPYYTQAEHLYHVHGQRGCDPTDPWASAPYLHPPVSHEPRIQRLHEDLLKQGLRPFHVPLGVMLDERNTQKSKCIRCSSCDGFPCLMQAKSDAQVVCVDPALEHANVSMITNAYVERLETSSSGREITSVRVTRNGEPETYKADVVVGRLRCHQLRRPSASIGERAPWQTGDHGNVIKTFLRWLPQHHGPLGATWAALRGR